MKIIKLVKPYENGQRTMDGYAFDGRAEFDMEAIERAYKSLNGYQLERKADELIDSLYDGDEPIYETDIGLCSVTIHWETKEPLVWCKVTECPTTLDYMEQHPEENLSWCKPYVDDNGNALIMFEGKAESYQLNGEQHTAQGPDFDLGAFARAVNADYDQYSGYSDTHIALDALHETGCASCPFRHYCDAMQDVYTGN